MPQIQSHCPDCHKQIKMEVGQAVIDLCLKWYSSYTCPFCGTAVEMDDSGFPPDEVRSFILHAEGEWHLLIEQSQLKKVAAMKILRQALSLSLTQTQRLLKCFPNSSIKGTQTEMEWLKQLLATKEIQATVIR